jgi:hypothetical protein
MGAGNEGACGRVSLGLRGVWMGILVIIIIYFFLVSLG